MRANTLEKVMFVPGHSEKTLVFPMCFERSWKVEGGYICVELPHRKVGPWRRGGVGIVYVSVVSVCMYIYIYTYYKISETSNNIGEHHPPGLPATESKDVRAS